MIGIDSKVTGPSMGNITDKLKREFKKIPLILEKNIKIQAPVDTGLLRSSIYSQQTGEWSYTVGTNIEYAPHIEYGTAPHVITPRNGKALKFDVGGQTVFSKRVNHPGTEANPFFERGIDISRVEIKGVLKT